MTAFGLDARAGVVARLASGHAVALAAVDVGVPADVWRAPSLNRFLALGPAAWEDVTGRLASLDARPLEDLRLLLPVAVGDYVDFYSSIHHAEHLGQLLRPGTDPLPPNWKHLPAGYHGRAGTLVVGGTPVRRPSGLVRLDDGTVARRPSARLDIELEVGFVVGVGSTEPVAPDDADRHVFGCVLVNDWSARDLQSFEYQPLGPFLAKSFCTSVGPWVVPLAVLRPFLVDPPAQQPPPDEALRARRPWGLDLTLTVELDGCEITRTSFADQWWTFAQQLAHLTSNGSSTRTGDLYASGTVSGPDRRRQAGSLIEATWGGSDPIELPDGRRRTFLEDGDTVVLRGWAGDGPGRVDLGECAGTVIPFNG